MREEGGEGKGRISKYVLNVKVNEQVYFSVHFLNTRYFEVCLHFRYDKDRTLNHESGVAGSVLCTDWCWFPFQLGETSRRSLEERVVVSVTVNKNTRHG